MNYIEYEEIREIMLKKIYAKLGEPENRFICGPVVTETGKYYDGACIYDEEGNQGNIVCLMALYLAYLEKGELEEVTNFAVGYMKQNNRKNKDVFVSGDFFSFDKMKKSILPVPEADEKKNILTAEHKHIGKVSFRIVVKDYVTNQFSMDIPLTNKIFESWKKTCSWLTEDIIMSAAEKNILPHMMYSGNVTIKNMWSSNDQSINTNLFVYCQQVNCGYGILTSSEALSFLSKMLNGSYYVVAPHDNGIICIPELKITNPERLKNIINEYNEQNKPNNHVRHMWHYNVRKHELTRQRSGLEI